jgi:hypothetical protein
MAFTARPCIGILVLVKGMMTITAGYPVTGVGVVGFVIEQNFSSRNVKHQSYRFVGSFGGKGCIAYHPHKQKPNCQTIRQLQLKF